LAEEHEAWFKAALDMADYKKAHTDLCGGTELWIRMVNLPYESTAKFANCLRDTWSKLWEAEQPVLHQSSTPVAKRIETHTRLTATLLKMKNLFVDDLAAHSYMESKLANLLVALRSEDHTESFNAALEAAAGAGDDLFTSDACDQLKNASDTMLMQATVGAPCTWSQGASARVVEVLAVLSKCFKAVPSQDIAKHDNAFNLMSNLLRMLPKEDEQEARLVHQIWEQCTPMARAASAWLELGVSPDMRQRADGGHRNKARDILSVLTIVTELFVKLKVEDIPTNAEELRVALGHLLESEVKPANINAALTAVTMAADKLTTFYKIIDGDKTWWHDMDVAKIKWTGFEAKAKDIASLVQGDAIDRHLVAFEALRKEYKGAREVFDFTIDETKESEYDAIALSCHATVTTFLCYIILSASADKSIPISKRRILSRRKDDMDKNEKLKNLVPACLYDKVKLVCSD
jgi:hypothetical protein